ncbi:MAG TPA: hypothetical protein ENN99_13170 [Chloroflexi bacterium]|nr:hypothetical protein [Chloroflexota bacterium]
MGARNRPLTRSLGTPVTETITGIPIRIGERVLTPIVHKTTNVRRRAVMRQGQLSGQGWGFVSVRPVAILEQGPSGQRTIPIRDKTAQLLGGLLLAACIIPLLLILTVHLIRKS